MSQIKLGIYRHYKGNLYEVVGFARHSETLEDMVVYKPLYGERAIWVRPLSMWENQIEIDGNTVKRFDYIGSAQSRSDLTEALRAISSTIGKCEKAEPKLREGSPQKTLTIRRIKALKIAVDLINRELMGAEES